MRPEQGPTGGCAAEGGRPAGADRLGRRVGARPPAAGAAARVRGRWWPAAAGSASVELRWRLSLSQLCRLVGAYRSCVGW